MNVTYWERANLLALLCAIFSCVFVTIPCGVLGQVWYLIVSIPDLCLLPYFVLTCTSNGCNIYTIFLYSCNADTIRINYGFNMLLLMFEVDNNARWEVKKILKSI